MITLKSIENLNTAALERVLLKEVVSQLGISTDPIDDKLVEELNEVHETLQEFLEASYRTTNALDALRHKVSNMIRRTTNTEVEDEEEEAA